MNIPLGESQSNSLAQEGFIDRNPQLARHPVCCVRQRFVDPVKNPKDQGVLGKIMKKYIHLMALLDIRMRGHDVVHDANRLFDW